MARNYAIDWSGLSPDRAQYIDLHDPFETYVDAQPTHRGHDME